MGVRLTPLDIDDLDVNGSRHQQKNCSARTSPPAVMKRDCGKGTMGVGLTRSTSADKLDISSAPAGKSYRSKSLPPSTGTWTPLFRFDGEGVWTPIISVNVCLAGNHVVPVPG